MMVKHLPSVTAKGLVRTIARQRHCHPLARQLAHPPCRQRGGIGERLVKHRRKAVYRGEIIGSDDPLLMVRTEFRCDLTGIGRLVIGGDIETDRAGLHRLARRLAHQRDHARAVHPTRKERTQRHIGHHA
jgi:Prephenate dehydrogenase